MRKSHFLALFIIGASALLMAPAITTGQFGGKGNKGGGTFGDPGALFDRMAGNRGFILISESRAKDSMTQFAQERGITNGQLNKQQFTDYQEYLKNKITQGMGGGGKTPGGAPTPGGGAGGGKNFGNFGKAPGGEGAPSPFGGGGSPFGGGGFGGKGPKGGGGGIPQGVALNPDAINDLADRDFKRYDRNEDHKLNKDEMPTTLLAVLATWDKNGDTFIDQTEYRLYYASRIQDGGNLNQAIATIIIQDDELERKPIIYKAGNLPRNIPSWFKELDTDTDGQVALCEWRAGKKPLEEFPNWDLNDDGYIIPEETLRTQEILSKNSSREKGDGTSLSSGERPAFGTGGFGERMGKGEFGKKGEKKGFGPFGGGENGENPFSGFMKKGKKGGGK